MTPSRRRPAGTAALLLWLLVAAAGPVAARDRHDHDQARAAVQAGEILPLKAILERVRRSDPGQVMDVEIERDDGRWTYRIKILRTGGSMTELRVDARDGAVLASKAAAVLEGRAARDPQDPQDPRDHREPHDLRDPREPRDGRAAEPGDGRRQPGAKP